MLHWHRAFKYVVLLVFVIFSKSWSYYYSDNFASGGNWITNLKYNMTQGVWSNVTVGANIITNWRTGNNKLRVGDGVNYIANPVTYNTSFYGAYALFTNTNFNASKNNPFGYEITRAIVYIRNGNASYVAGTMDMSIVEAKAGVTNGATTTGIEGTKFDNFVNLAEIEWENKSASSYYNWNQSSLPASKIVVTSVTDNSGALGNLQGILEWNYVANNTNTNFVRIRLVNDGNTVYWYVNPNPFNLNTGPTNTFYLVDTKSVSFSNNLQPMFGLASLTFSGSRPQSAELSNFTIRSVCSNVTTEISPAELKANASSPVYLVLKPVFGTNEEAGVEEFLVDLPDDYTNYTNWTGTTNAMSVSWVNTNGTVFKTFTNQYGDANPTNNGIVKISLKNNNKTLKVRFYATNVIASSDVFHPLKWGGSAGSNVILLVVSNFVTPTNADSVGKTLRVTVNNERYQDTTWTNNATTGPMESWAGDAMDMALITNSLSNFNSLTYKTYNSPVAYSSLLPNRVYEGVETVYQYDITAGNPDNNAYITRATITIPFGFGVDTNLIYSEKMSVSNGLYLYLTNFGITNVIIADYALKGLYLPANGGWDTISIKCTNTTNVPDGSSGVTVTWPAQVYSSLTLNSTNTLTNAYYPSQSLLVRKKPPMGSVSVTPNEVSNTLLSNSFEVLIRNTSTEDPNRLKIVRIMIPQLFTNVAIAVSASNGVITTNTIYGTNWLNVCYTNTPPNTYIPGNGGYDVIRMLLDDQVASLSDITNVTFYAEGDNLNGDNFIPLTEDSGGNWDVMFYTPPANAYAHLDNPGPEGGAGLGHHIYTDADVETNLAINIENKGEEANHISMARIVFPVGITNIQFLGDTKLAKWNLTNEYNDMGGGVTNSNIVLYLDYTNTLKTKIGAFPAEQDYITLKAWDAIDSPSNAHIDVYVKNAKTNYSAASEAPDTTLLSYIYPPISAKGYVGTTGGFIDWSTETNTVDYYITNMGRTKNEILQAKIYIPSDISTNIPVTGITSTLITNAGSITYNGGVITVNYGGGNGLKFAGGLQDRITFQLIDIVTNTVTVRLTNIVTNNRTNNILAETTSNAQNLYFQTPPVMATYKVEPSVLFVQTSGMVTDQIVFTVTNHGIGNNNINQVKITAPFTSAKVAEIYDAVMDTNWSLAPSYISMAGNLITLNYTNSSTNLTAGDIDVVSVFLKNDYTNELNLGWSARADNDLTDAVTNTNLGVMAGYTNRTYIVETAKVYAEPNTIVTATYSNYIRYSLKNGTVGDSTGQPIYRAKIIVTDPFTNIANISLEQAGSFTVTNIDATTMWILVDYTGGLQAGEADNIRFWLGDSWYVGTTNVNIASQVDYNDGGGWRDSSVENGKSTGIAFTFPPAAATAYVLAGEWVPEDFTNYTYQFYLKNTGESGNDIKLIKITPPATITNITSVTCLTKQLGGTFDGTNVWINYPGAGKLLSSLETDTVQLIGYDNVSTGNVYSAWSLKVANTTSTDDSYKIDVTVPGNKSISNIIYHPNYKASTYVEATNNIGGGDTNLNKVWTTKTSNTFKYYIYNQSDSGNNITRSRIFIPGGAGFFDTNSFRNVTSAKGLTNYFANSMTELWIEYSGLVPGDYDTVQFTVNDLLLYGETNLEWTNDTAYDTTDNRFKSSLEYSGKSRKSYFVMPAPSAKSGIQNPVPREVYLKSTNFTIAYSITNTGDGTGDLFNARLTIPAPFRATFDTNFVSNSLATNMSYNGGTGVLSLNYSNNFKPGTNDRIYLNLTASGLIVTNYSIDCQVSNSSYNSAAGDTSVNAKVLNIVNVPTYYVTPTSLSTTSSWNDVNVFILNNSGGAAKLKKVVLSFGQPFTNIIQTNSLMITNLSHMMGMITSLTLDYAADLNEISVGGNDAITFRLEDDFEVGDMTTFLSAKGYNGFQWVDMDQDVSGQTNIDFVMPSADATARINYNQIYTTTGETNILLAVINKGTGSNKLSKLKIHVPAGLMNLVVSNQVYTDAVTTNSNNTIYVDYQNNNLFASGVTDVIWLGFSNAINTGTNISFLLEGVNLTNGSIDPRFVAVPGEGGAGALNLRVDFPAVSVQGYINGRSQFFTINTNDKLEYRIVNGSINTYLTNARIYYDTNLFTVTAISNTFPHASNTVTNGYIDIVYTNGIQFSQRDILTIQMNYNITNITNTMLTSTVVLYGVTNDTFNTIDAGYTQKLDVTVASWGKIKGWVYPTNYTVTAKVYYPGTSLVATNIDGALASTVTVTNGEYSFTFIPNGQYTLELSAAMFRTYSASITVNSNMENIVSVVTMQNAVFSPGVTSNQTALCFDDGRSKVTFPSSSINRDISLNINLFDLTTPQKDDLGVNSNITSPSGTTGMKGYRFEVRNLGNSLMEGEVLKLDATLYLSYDLPDITSRGWTEDNLAIYYWDRVLSKWIKVGGSVDKANRYVTAQVSYLHEIYGVFSGKAGEGVIRNVVVRPRIFTPTKNADGYFGSVRITFELDQILAPDGFEVKIYDMRGKLVKTFDRKGAYAQGEVAWDSKDDEGYPVKGGVYIYRVLAGGKAYSGIIVIAR